MDALTPDYGYRSPEPSSAHEHIWPAVSRILRNHAPAPRRVLDLGCGNGSIASRLRDLGYEVCGVDASESGIRVAAEAHPEIHFAVGSVYDDLAEALGQFRVIVSLEVVEHLYSPRRFASTLYRLLQPGGIGVISTPYHGYMKNLALALTNRMDFHYSPLWEGGHIKFWSPRTLKTLLTDAGFVGIDIQRAGRFPPLAKSMVATFERRSSGLGE